MAALAPAVATALPAGWGYELISPADAGGGDINAATAAPDGEHVWLLTGTPIGEDQLTGNITTLAATRSGTGWTLRDAADPAIPGDLSYIGLIFSEDSSRMVVESCELAALACLNDPSFERVDEDGTRTVMVTFSTEIGSSPSLRLVGGSADLSRIFFQNNTSNGAPPLLPVDTHTQGQGLYSSHDGQLEFIGVDAAGAPLPCGAVLANDVESKVGTGFEQSGVSADGSTITFESPDPSMGCPEPVDVYVRHNGQSIDISAPTNGNPDLGATFVGSSRDGNSVYFTTASQLTAGDDVGTGDLYLYKASSATLTRITTGADPIAAVSPGGDYVYFVGSNPINGQGTVGEKNLFLYHAGTFTYIATAPGFIRLGRPMNESPSPTTPDGTHLLFLSDSPLTGQPTGGTERVFQYDATSDRLACVGCSSNGSIATAQERLPSTIPAAYLYARFQSDDGRRVMFSTTESLLPQDVNNKSDIYLWDQGNLSLVTPGIDNGQIEPIGMSADGRTVFFLSVDRLVPGVGQDNLKLYAAREGGGFPAAVPVPTCTDEACQGSPSVPVGFAVPGSGLVSGQGNLVQAPAGVAVKRKATVKHPAKKGKAKKKKRTKGRPKRRRAGSGRAAGSARRIERSR